MHPPPGSTILCCAGEAQDLLFLVLQLVGGRVSYYSPQISPHSQAAAQTRDAWPLVLTDSCCCRATDPDVALINSTGHDFTMVRWHCRLVTSGCSSPPSSLQFCLSFLLNHPFPEAQKLFNSELSHSITYELVMSQQVLASVPLTGSAPACPLGSRHLTLFCRATLLSGTFLR